MHLSKEVASNSSHMEMETASEKSLSKSSVGETTEPIIIVNKNNGAYNAKKLYNSVANSCVTP